jgi:hypothetical protein
MNASDYISSGNVDAIKDDSEILYGEKIMIKFYRILRFLIFIILVNCNNVRKTTLWYLGFWQLITQYISWFLKNLKKINCTMKTPTINIMCKVWISTNKSPACAMGKSLKNPQGISTAPSVWVKNDLRSSMDKFPANVSLLSFWYRNVGHARDGAERLRERPLISSKTVL